MGGINRFCGLAGGWLCCRRMIVVRGAGDQFNQAGLDLPFGEGQIDAGVVFVVIFSRYFFPNDDFSLNCVCGI